MTRYRIVERRCPDSTTFFIEYRKWLSWKYVEDLDHAVCGHFYLAATWATLEAARAWIAAQQAAQAPCATIYHQP